MERGRHQRHEDGLTVRHDGLRPVVLKIRGEHHDLIPGVCQGEYGIHHSLGGADRDHDLRLRIQGAPHETAALAGQSLPEVRRAHGDGVLMRPQSADLIQTVGQSFGRVKIREALRQVDGSALNGNAGHPPDDGIGEHLCFSADFLHGISFFQTNLSEFLLFGTHGFNGCPALPRWREKYRFHSERQ